MNMSDMKVVQCKTCKKYYKCKPAKNVHCYGKLSGRVKWCTCLDCARELELSDYAFRTKICKTTLITNPNIRIAYEL